MGVPVTIPHLGNDDAPGTLSEWYVAEGAAVEAGELLYRLERDHAAIDIEAEAAGVVRFSARVGDNPAAGSVVAQILDVTDLAFVDDADREPVQFPDLSADPSAEDIAGADWFNWNDDVEPVSQSEPMPGWQPLATGEAPASRHEDPPEAVDPALADSRWQMLMDVASTPVDSELPQVVDEAVPAWDVRPIPWEESYEPAEPAFASWDDGSPSVADGQPSDEQLPREWASDEALSAHDTVADLVFPEPPEVFVPAEATVPAGPVFDGPVDEPTIDELDPTAWVFEDPPGTTAAGANGGLLDVIASHDGGDWLAPSGEPLVLPSDPVTSHHSPDRVGRLPMALAHDVDHSSIFGRARESHAVGITDLSLSIDVDVRALCEALDVIDGDFDEDRRPRPEYAVVAAVGRALAGHEAFRELSDDVGLRVPDQTHERMYRFSAAASASVRELVEASFTQNADDAGLQQPGCVVSTFAAFGVREATARLIASQSLAFAMGAVRDEVAFEGRALVPATRMTIALTYDAREVADGAAAWLLGCVADHLQQPAGLLAS